MYNLYFQQDEDYDLNAFFNKTPDHADIPPTRPPINAVINNKSIQFGNWNIVATRFAKIWSLGMLLNKAKVVQTIKTAPKPDQNDCPEVLPIKKPLKKAAIATTHQGKK